MPLVKYYLTVDDYVNYNSHFGYIYGGSSDDSIILIRDRITMEELEVPSYLVILR